jgi:hypothetical protein
MELDLEQFISECSKLTNDEVFLLSAETSLRKQNAKRRGDRLN